MNFPHKVIFTGTPNVGKSTLFNQITGLGQHVGNWPGKTVESKKACVTYKHARFELMDLPGTYSLTSISPEETVARDVLLKADGATFVVVLNAAQLESGLSLLAEIFLLGAPVIIALNMMDMASKHKVRVDAQKLSQTLGLPVIPVVARKDEGVDALLDALIEVVAKPGSTPHLPQGRIADAANWIQQRFSCAVPEQHRMFMAVKILEGDEVLRKIWLDALSSEEKEAALQFLQQHEDIVVLLSAWRREWVRETCLQAGYEKLPGVYKLTDVLDKYAAHPWYGLVIFAGLIYLLFSFVFTLGAPLQEFLDTTIITPLAQLTTTHMPASFLSQLIADGLISGVGLVLSFVPVLFLFFGSMAFLEDVGYMTRAAYVMDRFMHRMGLHGRSFVPLFMGLGCNVPAMMATRVIDDKRARFLTMLLIPLVPCSARLAVIAFFAAAFFPESNALFSWLMIFLPIGTLVLVGWVASRFFMGHEKSPLIMELPLYHTPHLRSILIQTWIKTSAFIKQAGGIIAVFTLLIAAASWHPSGSIDNSVLGKMGHYLEPAGKLFGSDWRLIVALITSFIVKENTIATLGVLTSSSTEAATLHAVRAAVSPEGAIAFMIVQMLFVPCISTIIAFRRESGGWRWPMAGMALQTALSLFCGIVFYQLSLFF